MGFESNTIKKAVKTITGKIKLIIKNKYPPFDKDVIWFTLDQARDMKMILTKNVTNKWLKDHVVGHTIRFVYR
jgi:hypothetical protein